MDLIKVMEESLALISNKLSLANIEVVKLFNPLRRSRPTRRT